MAPNPATWLVTIVAAILLGLYVGYCLRMGAVTFTPRPITRRGNAVFFWSMLAVLAVAALVLLAKSLSALA